MFLDGKLSVFNNDLFVLELRQQMGSKMVGNRFHFLKEINKKFLHINTKDEGGEKLGDKHADQPYDALEFTHFMDDFLKSHPKVVEDQRIGWKIYWDKSVDLGELEKARADTVPEPPYHYDE